MMFELQEKDQMEMDSTEMWYIMTKKHALLLELQEFLRRNHITEEGFRQKEDQELSDLSRSETEWELRHGTGLQEKLPTVTEMMEESPATAQSPCDEDLRPTTSNPEVVEVKDLSFSPALVQCPNCKMHVTTEIQHKVGKTSYLLCYVSASLGCVGGCCLLPFFLNYFKDTYHFCPACHAELLIVSRI